MNDPLSYNIPGAGVETTLPLLPEGDYVLQISESIIKPNKENSGHNWHMKLQTTSPTTAVDGRPVSVNFPLFSDIGLQPGKDSTDPEAFKRNIFAAVDAIFGTDASNRPAFTNNLVQEALGKTVMARVVLDEWKGDKNNKIKRLKKVE